ncbi:hypothetical protein [Algibacter aquimarinus]|uniref:Uncharacterized protein n=1 Tax=Algibacter aquimarinus TaxID=1136748 RepID=A0ABP9HRL7_9FLAO
MRIIFICGSIEPGKDGVGDYTRRLASELIRQGVKVGIIAYKDGFVESEEEVNQEMEGIQILCYRLPVCLKRKERVALSKKWIVSKNPEWLSLQFVPYSFHFKGIPFGLGNELKELGVGRKWHIMFHELWLGLRSTDSIKFKVTGFLQRQIVQSLRKKLKFNVVHTHTKFYMNELTRINFNPKYLPIFSNIKFSQSHNKDSFVYDKKSIVFVHFGSIHPNLPIEEFVKELYLYSQDINNKSITLVFIGRSGTELKNWEKELKNYKVSYQVLGELTNEEVSHVLQKADYGVTTNPVFVLEKSGTVAALKEHNLPILVVSENTKPNNGTEVFLESCFFQYSHGNLSDFISSKQVSFNLKVKGIKEVSDEFLNSLLI